jgi:1-acyl-sn-glycerol-3-phosphate acyltransferase
MQNASKELLMAALRTIIFMIIATTWTMIYVCLCMLVAFLPYRARYFITSGWHRGIIFFAWLIMGIRYEVKGLENLPPRNTGAIVMAKHQSVWETIFLAYALGNPLCFVFKKELLMIPFFGWGIGLLRMAAIDRKSGLDAYAQMRNQAKERLAEGVWMMLFPEGTRSLPGRPSRYKTGGARLAIELDAPIVPIAHNAGLCWPKTPWVVRSGKVTVSILPVIHPNNRELREVQDEMVQAIESEMLRLPAARSAR